MGRAPCCEKVGLKRGRWTAEEDKILTKYIAANGEGSWRSLPKKAGLLRCGKSCRLRWINYLRDDLKRGNITKEEDEIIINLHTTHGNRWSFIAGHLPGRTDNEIKNYWNSHLSKRVARHTSTTGSEPKVGDDHSKRPAVQARRSSSAKKSTTNKGTRTGKNGKSTNVKVPSLVLQAEEDHSMVLDPDQNQAGSSTINGEQNNEGGGENGFDLCTSPVDSRLWGTSTEMESMLFGASEESTLEWGSLEEREKGMMSSSEAKRSDAGMVGAGEEEEEGPLQLLDWELEGAEAKLWDEAGDMWPWLWASDDGE